MARHTTVTVAGVGLSTSPLADAPGTVHEVLPGCALVHPQPRFDRVGWSGYLVEDGVLHLNVPAAMDWLPVARVSDLPSGRWARITVEDGRLVVPFELRREGERLLGRWLGPDGALLSPRENDDPAPMGLLRITPERYAPEAPIDRLLNLGAHYRLAVWRARASLARDDGPSV